MDKKINDRKKRKPYYDNSVKAALVRCWEIFDYPCGQRLQPLLKDEVERLREQGELECSGIVAEKLKMKDDIAEELTKIGIDKDSISSFRRRVEAGSV